MSTSWTTAASQKPVSWHWHLHFCLGCFALHQDPTLLMASDVKNCSWTMRDGVPPCGTKHPCALIWDFSKIGGPAVTGAISWQPYPWKPHVLNWGSSTFDENRKLTAAYANPSHVHTRGSVCWLEEDCSAELCLLWTS